MELIKKKISLRSIEFGDLSAKVSWLRKFFMESRAYMYCKRFDSSYWRYEGPAGVVNGCSVEIKVPDAIVSATYPSDPSYGDVVVISDDAEEFNDAYGTLSDAKQAFEDGCVELENGGGKPTHFHINVLLTEKYEDLGRFTEYDGHIEEIKDPEDGDKIIGMDLLRVKSTCRDCGKTFGRYVKICPSCSGERIDYAEEDYTGWVPEPLAAKSYSDSKLETFKRRTKTYDTEGNEIPFVLSRKCNTCGEIYGKYVTMCDKCSGTSFENRCELPYVIGTPFNVREGVPVEDFPGREKEKVQNWLYDIITEISFENEDGDVFLSRQSGVIIAADIEGNDGEFPIISIKYEIGRRIFDDNSEEPGVSYEEKYMYTIKSETFNITGRFPEPYDYIDIDYSVTAGVGWENMALTEATAYNDYGKTQNFIFDEAMAGIHDYSESVENVYIERGTSASFEPLNLMGQFNSVEEIERYRNDLFKISKENS